MTIGQKLITFSVRTYQMLISPLLGTRCRFHPTCSAYMADAVHQHGTLSGLWLGLKRIVRCHPWSDGGHDPAPSSDHSHPPLTSAKVK